MSTIVYDLGMGGRLETIPAWPEGPFKAGDFPILYSAPRSQIAHLVAYAETVAALHKLDAEDREQIVSWAREFFMVDAYRRPIKWRPLAAVAASRICYDHCTVLLQGPNFHSELARIRSTKVFTDETDRRPKEQLPT